MSLLTEWRKKEEQEKAKGQKKGGSSSSVIYKIKEGESYRLAFLTDLDDAERVEMWGNWPLFGETPNPEIWGKENFLESVEGAKHGVYYFFWVYDLADKKIKVLPQKFNGYSALPSLIKFSQNYGGVKGKSFMLSRDGNGLNTRYVLMPEPGNFEMPNDIKVASEKTCTHEVMMETIKKAYGKSLERAEERVKGNQPLEDGKKRKVSLDEKESF